MAHAFAFLRPNLDWLVRAYQAVTDDQEAFFGAAGWSKFTAKMEMVLAAERSARRAGDADYCVFGPGELCPPKLPFNCQVCAKEQEANDFEARADSSREVVKGDRK